MSDRNPVPQLIRHVSETTAGCSFRARRNRGARRAGTGGPFLPCETAGPTSAERRLAPASALRNWRRALGAGPGGCMVGRAAPL